MQEALQAAQASAVRYGHQELDGEHLFFALMEQDGGLAVRLIEGMGGVSAEIKARIGSELDQRPQVSGGAVEAGKIYVTDRFNRLLVRAGDAAKRMKDEFISVEHLLMAFLDEKLQELLA